MHKVLFEKYRVALLGQQVSAFWRGYGSALFLEFGKLTPVLRQDGTPGQSEGELGLMIQWSWRIEDENSILCGSWSEQARWETYLADLVGRNIEEVSLFGRLPELSMNLSGGRYINSFMTAEGQPAWVLFDRSPEALKGRSLCVDSGQLCESEN
jgi:hypothetical protein